MRRITLLLLVLLTAVRGGEPAATVPTELRERIEQAIAGSDLPANQRQFIREVLLPQMTNPVFAEETARQNAKQISLAEIQRIDAEWAAARDEMPLQRMLTDNACANELKRLVARYPFIVEAFVMDNQGANVGQNNITLDYWQGDEPKFLTAFNHGQGGIDIGPLATDPSVREEVRQISLPVLSPQGKVIGAVTFGLRPRN